MARRNAARDAALQHAKERERAAGKKVSRIEATGVNIAKSAYDPRVGAKALESMSTRELRAHARKADAFLSRSNQFVGAFAGTPVPKRMWDEYKRLEAINNARAQDVFEKFGGAKLATGDQTIAGRIDMLTPVEGANNQGRVFQKIERTLRDVNGERGVKLLLEQMRKKARGDYTKSTIRARLNSGEGALRNAGFAEFIPEVEELTVQQKELLIDHSTFFDIAVENMVGSPRKSEIKEIRDAAYEEHEGIEKSEEVYNNLREQIEWVKKIAPKYQRDERGRFAKRDYSATAPKNPDAKPARRSRRSTD